MKSRLLTFLLTAGLVLVLAACSSKPAGPTVIHVTLSEFKVEMDTTSVPAGPVVFEIENTGVLVHELVLEAAGAFDEPFEIEGVESEVEDIQQGSTVTLEWTLDQPGEYQLGCYIEGHHEAGMHVTFTVK